MMPENLSIVNSYNLGDLQVTDVLVVTAQDDNASLWIASKLFHHGIEENILSVYTVVDSESGPSFKMDVSFLYVVAQLNCTIILYSKVDSTYNLYYVHPISCKSWVSILVYPWLQCFML